VGVINLIRSLVGPDKASNRARARASIALRFLFSPNTLVRDKMAYNKTNINIK